MDNNGENKVGNDRVGMKRDGKPPLEWSTIKVYRHPQSDVVVSLNMARDPVKGKPFLSLQFSCEFKETKRLHFPVTPTSFTDPTVASRSHILAQLVAEAEAEATEIFKAYQATAQQERQAWDERRSQKQFGQEPVKGLNRTGKTERDRAKGKARPIREGLPLMSLDIAVTKVCEYCRHTVSYSENITHNLIPMWNKSGCYQALYESHGKKAYEVLPYIVTALQRIKENPDEFKSLEPSNKWGTVETAILSLEKVRDNFAKCPTGEIEVSR